MKKFLSLILSCAMIFSASATVFASEVTNEKDITVNLEDGHSYYDDKLNTNVIAFTINSDGSVNYLTEEEVNSIPSINEAEELTESTPSDIVQNDSKIVTRGYREWYEFDQTGGPYHYKGSLKKVSADLEAPAGGGGIDEEVSYTSSHFFSASVTTNAEKSAIQAGASIGWESSATSSTTYRVNLLPGQTGYIGFYPYYNRVVGDLELHSNWDGIISTKTGVSGYSVKLTDDGEADGLYKFIET
ncbi:hypothetical protein [Anaerotignum propionicum]|uniref:hypothetical protein n=1 Tax=Anaerotignum propionicum TaxID=28446 RepID=UPI00210CD0A9|nr:hypothetical protein [Anaerotignum propionicum]MCQ4935554.1 hypothetical protein [Anaerotignum propionicum]